MLVCFLMAENPISISGCNWLCNWRHWFEWFPVQLTFHTLLSLPISQYFSRLSRHTSLEKSLMLWFICLDEYLCTYSRQKLPFSPHVWKDNHTNDVCPVTSTCTLTADLTITHTYTHTHTHLHTRASAHTHTWIANRQVYSQMNSQRPHSYLNYSRKAIHTAIHSLLRCTCLTASIPFVMCVLAETHTYTHTHTALWALRKKHK